MTKKPHQHFWPVLFLLISLGGILLLLEQGGLGGVPRNLVRTTLVGGEKLVATTTQLQQQWNNRFSFFLRGVERLALLERERQQLLVDQSRLEALESENQQLREALEWQQSNDLSVIPFFGSQRNWFVQAGCQDGLQKDAAVFHDNVFMGYVKQGWPTESQISTLRDLDFRLEVQVGTSSARGVLVTERGAPEVRDLIGFTQVQVGENIFTAGGRGIPANLLVGRVLSLEEPENALKRFLNIEPYFWPENVSWVSYFSQPSMEGECL